jgi:hypothetical protein
VSPAETAHLATLAERALAAGEFDLVRVALGLVADGDVAGAVRVLWRAVA